jgi:anti-sigma regulatory factor (Ser/Thr protein kinase)/anti-anti-sigma regulatory factor
MSSSVFRRDQVIYIIGEFTTVNYRGALAAIYNAVNTAGYSDLVLDFSRCSAAFSSSMLPLCASVISAQEARIDFSLVLPGNARLERLFINTGWAAIIEPRRFDYKKVRDFQGHVPVIRFRGSEEQQSVVDKLVGSILSSVGGLARPDFAAVEWALNELTDNVLNHSASKIGGLVQLSMFGSRDRAIEISICDAGIGIPRSLREAYPDEIGNEMQALEWAIKEGVTRNKSTNQGNGLFGSFEICRITKGTFSIHSGHAILQLDGKGAVGYRNEKVPIDGTCINARIDLSVRNALESALKFGGNSHSPTDYIETKYENDSLDAISFVISHEARSFGSRAAAKPVRIKLENIVQMCQGEPVMIDFSGVSIISSSFADEVFGMLFAVLGPMRFMQSIRFVNISETVQGLIDRAISQRMRVA